MCRHGTCYPCLPMGRGEEGGVADAVCAGLSSNPMNIKGEGGGAPPTRAYWRAMWWVVMPSNQCCWRMAMYGSVETAAVYAERAR